jgi:hypothetical protein
LRVFGGGEGRLKFVQKYHCAVYFVPLRKSGAWCLVLGARSLQKKEKKKQGKAQLHELHAEQRV